MCGNIRLVSYMLMGICLVLPCLVTVGDLREIAWFSWTIIK